MLNAHIQLFLLCNTINEPVQHEGMLNGFTDLVSECSSFYCNIDDSTFSFAWTMHFYVTSNFVYIGYCVSLLVPCNKTYQHLPYFHSHRTWNKFLSEGMFAFQVPLSFLFSLAGVVLTSVSSEAPLKAVRTLQKGIYCCYLHFCYPSLHYSI